MMRSTTANDGIIPGRTDQAMNGIWIIIILLCALSIRLYDLGSASLWLDEALTIKISELPLSTLWVTAYDPTPPLFYSIEKIVLKFSSSEFALRIPSVIFSVIAIYFIYRASYKVAGQYAAIGAAVYLTFSVGNIEYGQEARAYSLLGCCISGAFLGLVKLTLYAESNSNRITINGLLRNGGILYALFSLASLYTHNVAVFFIFATQIYMVVLWFTTPNRPVKLVVFWVALNGLVFILWLPWLFASIQVVGYGTFNWLKHISLWQSLQIIRNVHGVPGKFSGKLTIDLAFFMASIFGLYFLRVRPALFALCITALLSSTILTWMFGYIKPVFMFRTILWGTLFTSVLIGIFIAHQRRSVAIVALILMVLLGINNVLTYFKLNTAENENWKGVAELIKKHSTPDDVFVICASYTAYPFAYYVDDVLILDRLYGWMINKKILQKNQPRRANNTLKITYSDEEVRIADLIGNQYLWFIESDCDQKQTIELMQQMHLNSWKVESRSKFKEIYLYRFQQS